MDNKNKIAITYGRISEIKKICPLPELHPFFQWVYLGKNVPFSLKLEQLLGTSTKIKIGDLLQEIAKEFRQEYIDYIGELSLAAERLHPIGCWWLSSVSEKNPFISDVFLHFCYIKFCQRIIGNLSSDLFIVCETRALAQALLSNLSQLPRTRARPGSRCQYPCGMRPGDCLWRYSHALSAGAR